MKKPFSKLTKPQQRVAIAKDVIARIKTKQFKPEADTFIRGLNGNDDDMSVEQLVNKEHVECDVCAKGGLFLSLIGFVNNFKIEDFAQGTWGGVDGHDNAALNSKAMRKLQKIFSETQLALIESAFEGMRLDYNIGITNDQFKKCKSIYKRFKSDKNRLIHICENIIKNKGTFTI